MAFPSDLSKKRVLVTGASGFTGRYVTAELRAHGCTVIGACSHSDNIDLEELGNFKVMDLRDSALVAQVINEVKADYVVHLAAVAFVAHGDADDFYQVNLLGTRNLLQALAAAERRPERVLLVSSANIYGNSTEGVIDETALPAPVNDYAVSKLAMEHAARLWSERLEMVIVRPFNYTGVGQSENFLVPKIVSHFRARAAAIELGNTQIWRDFSDVRALAVAYRKLLQAPDAVGRTINVCSGVAHSLTDIVTICSRLTGHSLDVRTKPALVRSNEVRTLLGDNSLLKSIVDGWSCPTLEETLMWMLAERDKVN